MADWYDHPQYFDMVFRDETPAEVSFFRMHLIDTPNDGFNMYWNQDVEVVV